MGLRQSLIREGEILSKSTSVTNTLAQGWSPVDDCYIHKKTMRNVSPRSENWRKILIHVTRTLCLSLSNLSRKYFSLLAEQLKTKSGSLDTRSCEPKFRSGNEFFFVLYSVKLPSYLYFNDLTSIYNCNAARYIASSILAGNAPLMTACWHYVMKIRNPYYHSPHYFIY